MADELKDFDALVTHSTWRVMEGITKGEPLHRVVFGVVEFARRWKPAGPAPVKVTKAATRGAGSVPLRDQLRLIAQRCSDPETTEALDRIVARMDGEPVELTDDEIVAVWQGMPGGTDGWLKQFGFLQFARALLKRQADKGGR